MKIIIAVLTFAVLAFAGPLITDSISFRIDTNHSNIGFAVPISGGFSSVHGKFSKFNMELDYDQDDVTRSKVNVVIDAASIDTGIDARDSHLRTGDFFDVKNHPEITFKSKSITKNGEQLTLTGDFTMRGITKEISFPFTITGSGLNDKKTHRLMGFTARLKIDRTKFNVNYQHPVPNFIGNEIDIYLHILTKLAKIAPKS